jgi:hypothetical protein
MESGSQPGYIDPTIAAINNVIGTLGAESTAALGAAAAGAQSIDPQPGSPSQGSYHDRYGAGALPNMEGGPRMTVDEWEERGRQRDEEYERRRQEEADEEEEYNRKLTLEADQLAEQLPPLLRQHVEETSKEYGPPTRRAQMYRAARAALLAGRLRTAEEVERFRGMSPEARRAYIPELSGYEQEQGPLDRLCSLTIWYLNAQTEEA